MHFSLHVKRARSGDYRNIITGSAGTGLALREVYGMLYLEKRNNNQARSELVLYSERVGNRVPMELALGQSV